MAWRPERPTVTREAVEHTIAEEVDAHGVRLRLAFQNLQRGAPGSERLWNEELRNLYSDLHVALAALSGDVSWLN